MKEHYEIKIQTENQEQHLRINILLWLFRTNDLDNIIQ